MMERDFIANPYSIDEIRVANYIVELTGVGGGDDPIGFLIASHAYLSGERRLTPSHPVMLCSPERPWGIHGSLITGTCERCGQSTSGPLFT
jgi:hypothetical protein